jgi:multidrug resistance efflux pump
LLKLRQAKLAFRRASELFDKKAISQVDYEQAKFAVQIAEAELRAARSAR